MLQMNILMDQINKNRNKKKTGMSDTEYAMNRWLLFRRFRGCIKK